MNIYEILEDILRFENDKERFQFEVEMLHLDIMATIRVYMSKHNIKKKVLSQELGISKKYLNKLFAGDKLINLKLLVQLQRIFNISFEFSIKEI